MNRYAYGGNNPVRRTGPTGLYFTVVGDPAPLYEAPNYLRGDWVMASLIARFGSSSSEYSVYVGCFSDEGRPLDPSVCPGQGGRVA
jgi:hypothetical protein